MMMQKSEKGQALIELIVFLPLMITLYSVIGGLAGSINGSINQQKITRSYFYYRIQNNSTIPGPKSYTDYSIFKKFGMFYIGWKDYFQDGETPVMPCYKITIPFKNSPQDKCEDTYTEAKTLWVRVGTVYGVCGGTYMSVGGKDVTLAPDSGYKFEEVTDRSSCLLIQ